MIDIQSRQIKTKAVQVEDLGEVFIRQMNGAQREEFEEAVRSGSMKGLRAKVASWCLCDEKGLRLYPDANLLNEKLTGIELDQIFDAATHYNRLWKDDADALKKS